MSGSAGAEIIEGDDPDNNVVENALKAIENAKQKFNLVRSQRLLVEAVHCGATKSSHVETATETDECLSELEDRIDRICMQESAIQISVETDTIEKIRSSKTVSRTAWVLDIPEEEIVNQQWHKPKKIIY